MFSKHIFPRWFLPFCDLMGILPVRTAGDTPLSFNPLSAVRSLSLLVAVAWSLAPFLAKIRYDMNFHDLTVLVEFSATLVLSALLCCVTTANSMTGRLSRIVGSLRVATRELLGSTTPRPDSFSNRLAAMVVSYVLLCALWGVQIWTEYGTGIFWSCYPHRVVLWNSFFGVEILFMKIVLVIDANFELLNERVRSCYASSDGGAAAGGATFTANDIEFVLLAALADGRLASLVCTSHCPPDVRRLHRRLCASVAASNALFGPPLLLVVANHFVTGVAHPFLVAGTPRPTSVCPYVAATAFSAARLRALTRVASRLTANAKATAYHVSRLLSMDLDKKTRKEVKHTLAQICSSRADITVCGLFKVDLPLILSFLGMVVTYMLVIIQLNPYDTV